MILTTTYGVVKYTAMYLERLELQGFKSFANRTGLEFLGPKAGSKGITAIVGPNGSGKSNVADGIRWVLGEQSMKLLRGKKSEDVIFTGSAKRARSGFAEVAMLLNNEDRFTAVDFPEILITRRLYRDGQSEYLLNKKKVRLADIQLLLAQASFGERHYSVIGQGMIEGLLQLTPEERREFFEEASGVKSLELKKGQALAKLELTEINLRQAEALLKEIEPRQRSLARQVKKLEERSNLEAELHGLQHTYYSSLWRALSFELGAARDRQKSVEERWKKKKEEVTAIEKDLGTLEHQETRSEQFLKMQKEYQSLLDQRNALREKEFDIRTLLERSKGAAVVTLPVATIIQELRGIREEAGRGGLIERVIERIEILIGRLEQPTTGGADPKLAKDLQRTVADLTGVGKKLADLQARIEESSKEEAGRKSSFFEAQRRLQSKQEELYAIDREFSETRVEVAKLETRREGLEHEMVNELKERIERVKQESARREPPAPTSAGPLSPENSLARIQKLKYQLELIGGIDPEIMREFSETNERYQALKTESEDLRKSITDLEQVIRELNRAIETQFTETFQKIRENFERYFKILFGGGSAKLERKKIEAERAPLEASAEADVEQEETQPETLAEKFAASSYEIEITASPPGKRIKSINVLSGGERALTAIALISAIIAVNPSPFVVLDEVDAALDESNSIRFSEIIRELSSKSQFIVITHNRYTMEHASTLYGVTMRDDGTSQLLSVKLDEMIK